MMRNKTEQDNVPLQLTARFAHCASPRHGIRQSRTYPTPPVCTRSARLDWGYEKLCLSEARCQAFPHSPYIPSTVVGGMLTLLISQEMPVLTRLREGRRDAAPPNQSRDAGPHTIA